MVERHPLTCSSRAPNTFKPVLSSDCPAHCSRVDKRRRVNVIDVASWPSFWLLLCALGGETDIGENVEVLKIECRFVHVQRRSHIYFLFQFPSKSGIHETAGEARQEGEARRREGIKEEERRGKGERWKRCCSLS